MNIQTTMVTTQNQKVGNVNFLITTFEQTTTVICDICGASASGTIQNLEVRGWYCGKREEFCPDCN